MKSVKFICICVFCVLFVNKLNLVQAKTIDNYLVLKNNDLKIWYQSPTKYLWMDNKLTEENARKNIGVFACKGEKEGIIVIVKSSKTRKEITLDFTDLQSQKHIIKSKQFIWNPMGCVLATGNDFKKHKMFDIILEQEPVIIEKDIYKAFYVTVNIPSSSLAGLYKGEIYIKEKASIVATIKLNIKVYDINIPLKNQIIFTTKLPQVKLTTNPIKRKRYLALGGKDYPININKVRERWIKLISENRLYNSIHSLNIPTPDIIINGKTHNFHTKEQRLRFNNKNTVFSHEDIKIDFTKYDKRISELQKNGINIQLRTPFFGVITGKGFYGGEYLWGDLTTPAGNKILRKGYSYLDNDNMNEEFPPLYKKCVSMVIDHISQKYDRTLFKDVVADEPKAVVFSVCKKVAAYAIEANNKAKPCIFACPNSLAMLKIIRGDVKHFFVHSNTVDSVAPYIKRTKRKDEIFEAYNFPHQLSFRYEPLNARSIFWWAWDLRIDKIWHWSIGDWRLPPDESTYGGYYLIYPNENDLEGDFLKSIRFEQLREGVEDYSLFKELTKRIKKVKKSLNINDENFPVEYRSDEISHYMSKDESVYLWSQDTNLYCYARRKLCEEIINTLKHPYILLKMEPGYNETKRESVVFKGYVESETQVFCNNEEIEIHKNKFSLIKNLKIGENRFVFKLQNNKNIKILERIIIREKIKKEDILIKDTFSPPLSFNGKLGISRAVRLFITGREKIRFKIEAPGPYKLKLVFVGKDRNNKYLKYPTPYLPIFAQGNFENVEFVFSKLPLLKGANITQICIQLYEVISTKNKPNIYMGDLVITREVE